ncbi:MAG: prolipoprotein diacylglyceryl transferase [Campylobacter sp.]|nr:prolipoprotein diacylglyceryl transferase [Campylobacter sp.]
MTWWNEIYSHIDPIAFEIFGFNVYWYGIMFITALVVAFFIAKYIIKKDKLSYSDDFLDNYFAWIIIGVLLGAKIGYILIYSNDQIYYLTRPWQMFNPFQNGEFVGISGLSYHGAAIGFIISTLIFCYKYKTNVYKLLDLVALSVPLGYTFGRIGNFLNQELFGKVTTVPWGILVDGELRHPSQLYEGFLEGILIFVILYVYRKKKKFDAELIALYSILYSIMRFISEIFREPDAHMGVFGAFGLSMGQILSLLMFLIGATIYLCYFGKNFLRK